MLQESDDLDMLGVTLDSKMNFKKHLLSVSRAASRRLGILRKSFRVFNDRLLLERYFCGFARSSLENYCCAPDTHLKLPDSVVSCARFLNGAVLECNIVHRRLLINLHCSMEICVHVNTNTLLLRSCTLLGQYSIMHAFYVRSGVSRCTLFMVQLLVTNVPLLVKRSALVDHRYTYVPIRCRTEGH